MRGMNHAVLPVGQITQLRDGFGAALAVLFMISFFWGVAKIWGGANEISRGNPDGKAGVIAGILIAASAMIMGVFYYIFGLSGSILTPRF